MLYVGSKNPNYHIRLRPDPPLGIQIGCCQACCIRVGPVRPVQDAGIRVRVGQPLGIPISRLAIPISRLASRSARWHPGQVCWYFRSGCCQPFGILIKPVGHPLSGCGQHLGHPDHGLPLAQIIKISSKFTMNSQNVEDTEV